VGNDQVTFALAQFHRNSRICLDGQALPSRSDRPDKRLCQTISVR
jgi:hypothetical protein